MVIVYFFSSFFLMSFLFSPLFYFYLLEVEKYVEHILNTILKSKNLFQHSQFLIENAKEHLIKSVDYVSYGMTDILDLGELDITQCESLFATHGTAKEVLIDVVKEFWKAIIF